VAVVIAHKVLYQSGFDEDGMLTYRASCRCEWTWSGTDRSEWQQAASDHVDEGAA
jgi:hypothetical protein